jgi:Ulp1 family protease
VEDAMDEYQDKSEQFVDAFNIAITRKDLLTLHDGQWLNDEVILLEFLLSFYVFLFFFLFF